jgi:hypothetical protein
MLPFRPRGIWLDYDSYDQVHQDDPEHALEKHLRDISGKGTFAEGGLMTLTVHVIFVSSS